MTDTFIDVRELDADTLRSISEAAGVVWPEGGMYVYYTPTHWRDQPK